MPANLAALLFTIFIISVLLYDYRKHPDVSGAMWLPTIWISYTGSRAISYYLAPGVIEATESDYMSGNLIDRTFLIILIIVGILILLKRNINLGTVFKDNIHIFIFFMLLGISILWSDYKVVSLKRWIRTIGDLIQVLILFSDSKYIENVFAIIRRCAYLLIPLSLLYVKYYRHMGVGYSYDGTEMWIGVTSHKNSLGQLAVVSAIYFIWKILFSENDNVREKLTGMTVLLMALFLLKGPPVATSKTSLAALFLGSFLLVILYLGKNRPENIKIRLKYGVVFSGLAVVMGNLAARVVFNKPLLNVLVTSSGRDMTFTGRTDLWVELLSIAKKKFLIGVGYGSFWIGDLHRLWDRFGWGPESAHNGYIDIYLELGIIGLILLFVLLRKTWMLIVEDLASNYAFESFRFVIFILVVFYNITESSFAKPTSLLWFILLITSVSVKRMVQEKEKEPISVSNLAVPS